ncbi:hypothetical protein B0T26DRAFT_393302 [Lasiosphaeria miniovina]|uniref:Uncharacterized protein n=1 Tax=Lasiosphaeria miniovina TaxID=1954250 RepID=A0AA40A4F6_9PEZI|nr:uncharacterized protein B0T26DRAFT_393302 [Lasiosphaeria miniovina]KAK0709074.1 hypothetical protein B0T26DRAFT_393302 [Lasiosphaeria miniovina]
MSGFPDRIKQKLGGAGEGTGIRGQIKSLVGRGDDLEQVHRAGHVAQPLSSLRDPASFPPPPRHIGRRATTTSNINAPSLTQASSPSLTYPSKSPPPTYYSPRAAADDDYDGSASASGSIASWLSQTSTGGPPLPPRLPPRSSTVSGGGASPPPPPPQRPAWLALPGRRSAAPEPSSPPLLPPPLTSPSTLNQGAIGRLGAAGISVPAFGIGPGTASPSSTANGGGGGSDGGGGGGGGTTWKQKQNALRTASALQKEPSKVSLAELQSAGSTFQNFSQRHGDQVAAGLRTAGNLRDNARTDFFEARILKGARPTGQCLFLLLFYFLEADRSASQIRTGQKNQPNKHRTSIL